MKNHILVYDSQDSSQIIQNLFPIFNKTGTSDAERIFISSLQKLDKLEAAFVSAKEILKMPQYFEYLFSEKGAAATTRLIVMSCDKNFLNDARLLMGTRANLYIIKNFLYGEVIGEEITLSEKTKDQILG